MKQEFDINSVAALLKPARIENTESVELRWLLQDEALDPKTLLLEAMPDADTIRMTCACMGGRLRVWLKRSFTALDAADVRDFLELTQQIATMGNLQIVMSSSAHSLATKTDCMDLFDGYLVDVLRARKQAKEGV